MLSCDTFILVVNIYLSTMNIFLCLLEVWLFACAEQTASASGSDYIGCFREKDNRDIQIIYKTSKYFGPTSDPLSPQK